MDSIKKIGLVQVNNSFANQNYFPYSVGLLQAYAESHLQNPQGYQFLLPIYSRIPVDLGIERMCGADYIFFSTYVAYKKTNWSIRTFAVNS